MEVEAEHRLQVVPVDLHRLAPHLALAVFLLDRWIPPLLSACAFSHSHSRVWFGFGEVLTAGKGRPLGARTSLRGFFFFFFLFEREAGLPLLQLLGPWGFLALGLIFQWAHKRPSKMQYAYFLVGCLDMFHGLYNDTQLAPVAS